MTESSVAGLGFQENLLWKYKRDIFLCPFYISYNTHYLNNAGMYRRTIDTMMSIQSAPHRTPIFLLCFGSNNIGYILST